MIYRILALVLPLLLCATPLLAAHGLSIDGKLKYPADFQRFDYTAPEARAGGALVLYGLGGFDKMNPFTLKGISPLLQSELMFESLMVHSLDEPFAEYGLLAADVAVAADGLSVVFTLRPEARFSDGTPVTAQDVKFSFDTLKSDQAHPSYQSYWRDVREAEVLGPHRVRFHFTRNNRELPLIVGDMPVFSQAYYQQHPFTRDSLEPPVASGPYLVESLDPGKTITYRRNPDYWGWHLPVNRGFYNFERIVVKYFMDPVVALEGFKAGEFDFIHVYNSKQWARDFHGPKFTSGELLKETLPHKNGQGMQGFVFNLRRPKFQDIRVRQALTLAFDFEWANRNLFYGQYTRSGSYFSNSELAASGRPSPAELKLLEPLRGHLDPAVFGEPVPPPSTDEPSSLRHNLRQAKKLLTQAGYHVIPGGKLVNAEGEPLVIDFLLAQPAFERILAPYANNLLKLGITLNYRTVDISLYQRRLDEFDFDMVVSSFAQSQSPGNEQRNFWHSASAGVKGSSNLMGLRDPAVDALVEAIIYAPTREALVTACHALDRVLLAGNYLVPNWHIPYHRIAYRNVFRRPETVPLYYSPQQWLLSWWVADQPRHGGAAGTEPEDAPAEAEQALTPEEPTDEGASSAPAGEGSSPTGQDQE